MSIETLLQTSKTNAEIADIIGKSKITVIRLRKQLNLPAKIGHPKLLTKRACIICDGIFSPRCNTHKFCSVKCSALGRSPRSYETLVGKKFGRLTIMAELTTIPETFSLSKKRHKWWICNCECGTAGVIVNTAGLYKNETVKPRGTQSCGCLRREVSSNIGKSLKGKRSANSKSRFTAKNGYVEVYVGPNIRQFTETRNGNYVAEHVYVMSTFLGRPIKKGENVHHKNGIRDDNRIENLELWSKRQPAGQRIEDKTAWAIEWLRTYNPESLVQSS